MEFWYKLYLVSEKVVYLNRDTYTLRKYSDVQNYLSPEFVCSDIQQRLQFISILAAKNIDVKDYIENLILLLNYRIGFFRRQFIYIERYEMVKRDFISTRRRIVNDTRFD